MRLRQILGTVSLVYICINGAVLVVFGFVLLVGRLVSSGGSSLLTSGSVWVCVCAVLFVVPRQCWRDAFPLANERQQAALCVSLKFAEG